MSAQSQFPNEQTATGAFERQEDVFRNWVTEDGSSGYPAAKGRYHLYVSWACPWAHRTIIVRKLKKLEDVISMTVVDPIRDDRGWAFHDGPDHIKDQVNGFAYLSEAYAATDTNFQERVTVPVLWDKETKKIVSNADDDIMRMFNSAFDSITDSNLDLCPADLREEIDQLNGFLYENVNDGVYRAGFATSQSTYETGVQRVFESLDELESRLTDRRYLFGNCPLESD